MGRSNVGGRSVCAMLCFAAAGVAVLLSCAAGRSEGLDAESLPPDVRPDYELFAERCSKCHSLARPLESGITDDAFWKKYVERMRRQPGSGISPADEEHILHFLHYYSLEKKGRGSPAPAPSEAAPAPALSEAAPAPAPSDAAPAPSGAAP
jgi:hypothetical protein